MIMMMKGHLWAFPLLLILCHNDIGHHKEGVLVLENTNNNKKTTFKSPL